MAENIPYGYNSRNIGQMQRPGQQQRPPSGNMRYSAMGMAPPRPQPPPAGRAYPPNATVQNASQNTDPAQKAPNTLPDESKPSRSDPLSFLGISGLDNEKLILMALIVILARSGADWVILAALIYIMM
ncbi:MAG: hypothetical protein ACI4J0_06765 [Huintestinicola sp.]|uniref:hypothetical protein n=1 Tax=Huintestinicola sp. TaxID=2981661 RepID=UPI003F047AEC